MTNFMTSLFSSLPSAAAYNNLAKTKLAYKTDKVDQFYALWEDNAIENL